MWWNGEDLGGEEVRFLEALPADGPVSARLNPARGARLPKEADPEETRRDATEGHSEAPPENRGATPYIQKGVSVLTDGFLESWQPR